ncbi:MAG: hypothetical protein ACYC5A_03880, partial [Thermoleophilia bacterium]
MAIEGIKKPISRDAMKAHAKLDDNQNVTGGSTMRINLLTSRIEVKILVLVAAILCVGFGIFGVINVR